MTSSMTSPAGKAIFCRLAQLRHHILPGKVTLSVFCTLNQTNCTVKGGFRMRASS